MALQIKNVLISDEIDDKCVNLLKSNGINVVKDTKLSKDREKLLNEIPKYDALIVRSATTVSKDVIDAGKNLKIIGRAGTGVDNIDSIAATKNGVVVMNTPAGNMLSAAEHTCCLIINLSRNVPAAVQTMREGKWERKTFMGSELFGKVLAIVGLGRIGKEVAIRMQSFGMKTIGFDPIISAKEAAEFNVEWLSLEEIWPKADYITVHTPLIPQTKNLINDNVFNKCKKGVKVINCARGGIIDETSLIKALENNQCGGAGLDTFIDEPPPNDHPLRKIKSVVCTPHLGASTIEAQTRVAVEIAQQIVDARDGKQLVGAINAAAMVHALSDDSKIWTYLATSLGRIATKLLGIENGVNCEITITTMGSNFKHGLSFLPAAILIGILDDDTLNLVSAPNKAIEMGIQLEKKHVETTSNPVLDIVVKTKMGSIHIGGICNYGHAMLIQLDDFLKQPIVLEGNLAFINSKYIGNVFKKCSESNFSKILAFSSTSKDDSWSVLQLAADCLPKDMDFEATQCFTLNFKDHLC